MTIKGMNIHPFTYIEVVILGLTYKSTGRKAVDGVLKIKKLTKNDKVIALAGNPNVGKSTVFNNLTGMNQHTGNWPGKTVTNAQGYCSYNDTNFIMVDIPGTYSLMAHSAEEEVARDFICFANPDAIIVVCDAVCLERNLNLVLQIIEISKNVVVCVNMMDEAKKRGIAIDIDGLSMLLGVPVVGVTARKKKSLDGLMRTVYDFLHVDKQSAPVKVKYSQVIEQAISIVESELKGKYDGEINSRWLAIKLIDNDEKLTESIARHLGYDIYEDIAVKEMIDKAMQLLNENGILPDTFRDKIVYGLVSTAESICAKTVEYKNRDYNSSDTKIDRVVTSKITGIPIMICLLAFVFWLTITGANYPSQLLSDGLFWIGQKLADLFVFLKAPDWLRGVLVDGLYRVLAWVVSVMLPPMAIFFPLFTLLEDSGYLPRVAFNLDKFFKKCNACGKQALTMWLVYIRMRNNDYLIIPFAN